VPVERDGEVPGSMFQVSTFVFGLLCSLEATAATRILNTNVPRDRLGHPERVEEWNQEPERAVRGAE